MSIIVPLVAALVLAALAVVGIPAYFAKLDATRETVARTVTVTLPQVGRQSQIPVPEDYKHERPISVSNHGSFIGVSLTAQGVKQDVVIHPDELEPLALTFLAYARAKTTPTTTPAPSSPQH